jgi:2-amino-4-hydroxy-6-hydroxymethyldihydropteridine diphosphokinase
MARMVAHIGMGSNIGDRGDTLMRAVKMLSEVEGVAVRRLSQFVRTEPLGGPADQPVYFNAAVEVSVDLSPRELLSALQDIERQLGRDRSRERRWGPRTCDLDILLMGETVVREEPDLVIPHPRMHERAFVLEPLATIAPGAVHPVLGKAVSEMLDDVRSGRVKPTLQPNGAGEGETASGVGTARGGGTASEVGTAGEGETASGVGTAGEGETARGGVLGQAPLLSIIGLPASGKTTLAELLAMELPAEIVQEDYEGNPFLAESYAGPHEMRLPAQTFYLLSRVSQLSGSHWPATGTFVSDYGFCQDRLYASLRLSPEDFAAYEALHARVAPLVHPPSAMVFLDAEPAALLERIAVRGRSFEKAITADFLSAMRDAYNDLVQAAECPVLTVRCDEVDLRNHRPRAELIQRIRTVL